MGLVVQLDLSEYWTTCDITSTPFFPKYMSRDRFWLITSFFHLVNNDDHVGPRLPGFDPLFKLGSLFKKQVKRFNSTYQPHRQMSLDKGTIPWRGNLSFRCFNPDKPQKYGIKVCSILNLTFSTQNTFMFMFFLQYHQCFSSVNTNVLIFIIYLYRSLYIIVSIKLQ